MLTRIDLLKALNYGAFKYLLHKGILNTFINKVLRIVREKGYNHIFGVYNLPDRQKVEWDYEFRCDDKRFGISVHDGWKLYVFVIYKLEYHD